MNNERILNCFEYIFYHTAKQFINRGEFEKQHVKIHSCFQGKRSILNHHSGSQRSPNIPTIFEQEFSNNYL